MLPPRFLESLLHLLLPPDSREHVLGDLRERCASTESYLVDAISVLGPVIIGRIRRTTDFQVFLMEALTVYLSFTSAAWYLGEQSFLYHDGGFLRLALPTIVAVIALLFCNAYSDLGNRSFYKAILQTGGSLSLAALGQVLIFQAHANFAVPFRIMLYGGLLSCLLIAPIRILFPPPRRPQLVRSNPVRPFWGRARAQWLSESVKSIRNGPKLSLILAMLAVLLAAALLLGRMK